MSTKLAAIVWPNRKIYFFKGNLYYRYDVATENTDQAAHPITGNWRGIWSDGIDAAVIWPGSPQGKAYFFKGNENTRFDIASEKADEGPIPIERNWPGVWPDGIDAAVSWPNGKVYFFKGPDYVGFDSATGRIDGGVRRIAGNWPGVWNGGFETALVYPGASPAKYAYFFKGSEYLRFDIAANKVDAGPSRIADNWRGLPF
ncbi:MAG: hemopexin repeat-containing protein [Isosphaeraceae bacterium]|nr:hemopexin repeat-containing protein [Isosphaeraceae bacterium]